MGGEVERQPPGSVAEARGDEAIACHREVGCGEGERADRGERWGAPGRRGEGEHDHRADHRDVGPHRRAEVRRNVGHQPAQRSPRDQPHQQARHAQHPQLEVQGCEGPRVCDVAQQERADADLERARPARDDQEHVSTGRQCEAREDPASVERVECAPCERGPQEACGCRRLRDPLARTRASPFHCQQYGHAERAEGDGQCGGQARTGSVEAGSPGWLTRSPACVRGPSRPDRPTRSRIRAPSSCRRRARPRARLPPVVR